MTKTTSSVFCLTIKLHSIAKAHAQHKKGTETTEWLKNSAKAPLRHDRHPDSPNCVLYGLYNFVRSISLLIMNRISNNIYKKNVGKISREQSIGLGNI